MLLVTLATIVGTIWLYIIVPKGFFPTEDTGYLRHHRGRDRHLLPRDGRSTRARSPRSSARTRPSITSIRRSASAGPIRSATAAACWSRSSRGSERGNLRAVIGRLRREANVVPGMRVFFQPIQNIRLGGRLSKSEYQYTLQSNDTDALYKLAPEMRDKIAQAARPARRHHRPLHQESAAHDRDRPREGGGLRHLGRSGAPGTVQRLRHSPGRHHLHARPTIIRSSWKPCRSTRQARTT